jgi:hypothetical protein
VRRRTDGWTDKQHEVQLPALLLKTVLTLDILGHPPLNHCKNRTYGPYLTATSRILNSVLFSVEPRGWRGLPQAVWSDPCRRGGTAAHRSRARQWRRRRVQRRPGAAAQAAAPAHADAAAARRAKPRCDVQGNGPGRETDRRGPDVPASAPEVAQCSLCHGVWERRGPGWAKLGKTPSGPGSAVQPLGLRKFREELLPALYERSRGHDSRHASPMLDLKP